MPLVHNTVYVIRNHKTQTVLDFTGNAARNVFVMGWGWNGGNNQQWRLIQVAAANTWKLQNQDNQRRFLCPRLEDAQPNGHHRLAGGVVSCDFVIEPVGETGGYRIQFNELVVTLVTGQGVYNIQDRDRVLDLHADGPPIALLPVVEPNDPAQIWSFQVAATTPVTSVLNNGQAYKIVNYQTGTVLDVADTSGNPVHGLVSKGGDHHKWTVTGGDPECYTFESPTVADCFLAPDVVGNDLPRDGTALIGRPQAQAARFTVRNVPGTRLYKIFLGPMMATTDSVSGLAVNLAVVDGAPDSLDGAVVRLQAAEAQNWYFVQVQV